jgi:zinc transport system substrate-binding protein
MIPMQPRPRAAVPVALLVAAVPLLAGCGGPTGAVADGKVGVVTSFYPLQYVAQRIAGGHAEVANLTHPGQEPHDVELTVPQTAELSDAAVVVYEKGFQASVDQAVEQNGPDHVVDAARSADLSGDDPHFWQDPTKLSRVAAAVEEDLVDVDPAHAADYRRNLTGLQRDLAALDRSYRTGLARCATSTIVVSHDAFSYLGRRYGLKVVGINGLSPEAEPSPAHLRTLQDLIRTDGITTVFSERLASRQLADTLAGDLGIGTAVLDPIEGLSDATAQQDYLSLMRSNLRTLREADDCS